MRLPADAGLPLTAIGLSLALAGCGIVGGGDHVASAQSVTAGAAAQGPAADYPMVLGEPFTVDGELFTPADTLNYDAVGYAALDDGWMNGKDLPPRLCDTTLARIPAAMIVTREGVLQ